MKTIQLDLRYYHLPRRAPITEADFHHKNLRLDLPAAQIALILVDVWSDHYVATHLQRGRDITLERILPVAAACRAIGATVVHAPSPDCARRYTAWTQYASDDEVFGPPPSPKDEWPPADFRAKKNEYEKWARPPEPPDQRFDDIIKNRSIIPEAVPQDGDHVVLNGPQLHRLLKHKGILYLFYAGFAANMCVPFRDYGMRAMKNRGYDIVLLRDCTTAIEVADTCQDQDLTRAAVIDTEISVGYTVSSKDMIAACQA